MCEPLPRSAVARLELLADLFAPPVLDEDGNPTGERDPSAGVISREQLLALLEAQDDGLLR